MKTTARVPIPTLKALRKLGQDINDGRRRHRITIKLMAERAGISRATIGKIDSKSNNIWTMSDCVNHMLL